MELLRARLCDWRVVAIDAIAVAPKDAPEPRLAVGRANGAVELWDTKTMHMHASSPGCDRRSVRGFVWVAPEEQDGSGPWRLLSAGLHTEITEWDLSTLKPQVSVASGGGAVWSLCAFEGNAYAACDDGTVRVFSLEGGAGEVMYKKRLKVGKERLLSMAISDEDMFVGGSDSRITKWSLKTGTCEAKMMLEQPKGGASETLVWALVALGNNEVASGDSLGLVQIWDTIACTSLFRFAQHQADVLTLSASPEGLLMSAGIDTKISVFQRQPDAEERWVFKIGDFTHKHDVRSLACDGNHRFMAGGVAGNLIFHRLQDYYRYAQIKGAPRAQTTSAFSPVFQSASVAEDSRVVLCQREKHLELWYLQPPKEAAVAEDVADNSIPKIAGRVQLAGKSLPEPQMLLRVQLKGETDEVQHLTASAITPDGRRFAASDLDGTRLFHLNIEDLEVRREKSLPEEVQKTAASALLFCGSGLLALATWATGEVIIVDAARLTVVARFPRQNSSTPVVCGIALLATAGEWLAAHDGAGCVNVFNVDSLQHHARVPVGDRSASGGTPTALGFDSLGKKLFVVLSTHEVIVYDVEARTLASDVPSTVTIPRKVLPVSHRISGVGAPPGRSDKILFWGHRDVLSYDVQGRKADEADDQPAKKKKKPTPSETPEYDKLEADFGAWRRYPGMQHILSLRALDEARWGTPVLKGYCLDDGSKKRKGVDEKKHTGIGAMVLSLEVAPQAVLKSLPQAFERKRFVTYRKHENATD